jgi:hypothetical protein
VDFWAFSEEEWGKEIMSMHHTRNALQKLTPQVKLSQSDRGMQPTEEAEEFASWSKCPQLPLPGQAGTRLRAGQICGGVRM